jgi:hypothetical protein
VRTRFVFAAVVAALVPTATASADTLTMLLFKGSGHEYIGDALDPTPAVNNFGITEAWSGGDRQNGASASDAVTWKWDSPTAYVESNSSASVNGTSLKASQRRRRHRVRGQDHAVRVQPRHLSADPDGLGRDLGRLLVRKLCRGDAVPDGDRHRPAGGAEFVQARLQHRRHQQHLHRLDADDL